MAKNPTDVELPCFDIDNQNGLMPQAKRVRNFSISILGVNYYQKNVQIKNYSLKDSTNNLK